MTLAPEEPRRSCCPRRAFCETGRRSLKGYLAHKKQPPPLGPPAAASVTFSAHRDEGHQCENNYFTEMCSGSEAGSYLRIRDYVYHSTLGLRVIKKKKRRGEGHKSILNG